MSMWKVISMIFCLFLEKDRYSHASPATIPAIKTETARFEYGAEAINWYGMAKQAKIDVSRKSLIVSITRRIDEARKFPR